MRDAHGLSLWTDQRDASRWQSSAIALLVTATLFTAALVSMSRLGVTVEAPRVVDDRPMIVFFPPVPQVEPPKTIERARPSVTTPALIQRVESAASSAPTVAPMSLPPAEVKRDSGMVGHASADAIASLRRLEPMREVPTFSKSPTASTAARGAPIAPSGVTTSGATLTPAQRDSIVTNTIADAVAEVRQEMGRNSGTHPVTGQKAGALSAGVSIPFPLFSSGPSPAERKRNEAIDADNQRRLRRLQDVVIAQRDSVRLDSLRRDSLAKRAIRP